MQLSTHVSNLYVKADGDILLPKALPLASSKRDHEPFKLSGCFWRLLPTTRYEMVWIHNDCRVKPRFARGRADTGLVSY